MATKGGGYVVVYITAIFFYSGQSLSDIDCFRLRCGTLAAHCLEAVTSTDSYLYF